MADKAARKVTDGKIGDRFEIAKGYEGTIGNAVGVPLDQPRGKAYPIPPGDGPVDTFVYEREDLRKVDKNTPINRN